MAHHQKGFSRADRVAEQIRRELADLLRLELKDPRIRLVSLTAVEITPDYTHAKVFYTSLADSAYRSEIEEGLRRGAGFLRRELGRRIRLHHTPELHFVYDISVERGTELSKLIDAAVQPPKSEKPDEPLK
ncbi:MAG: 30S ribosome-binding factor RbfA [Proteobacteria bacterium]|nr:30S ribosome-binding factor RbfA [Pseudomonadota bacterium]HQR02610.1 30S ribosome-binding factor RbfA [Rhodocyclaceae bacterium]